MLLSRQQRERLVLDLYNQGKNTRDIAHEVGISFRDIGAILKKATQEQERSKEQAEKMSQSAQAYEFFSKGKTPIQVAIALNLRQVEVTEFYREYWILEHQYDLSQIYEEIKGDIGSFLNLYKLAKSEGMNIQQIIRLLKIANDHLPAVKQRYESLKREVDSLEGDKRNSAMILQELSDQISDLRNTSDSCRLSLEEEKRQMSELHQKKMKLEALVNDYQDNNEEYVKFTKTVQEKVFGVLSNAKVFLRGALLSITESIRNNPERYRSLFYNMSPSIIDYSGSSSQDYTASCMYEQQQQQNSSLDYDTEVNAAIIIDEAEKLYNKLVRDCLNKIIMDYAFSTSSSSSLPLLPQSNEEQQSHLSKTNNS
jgi:hypothetical protein